MFITRIELCCCVRHDKKPQDNLVNSGIFSLNFQNTMHMPLGPLAIEIVDSPKCTLKNCWKVQRTNTGSSRSDF